MQWESAADPRLSSPPHHLGFPEARKGLDTVVACVATPAPAATHSVPSMVTPQFNKVRAPVSASEAWRSQRSVSLGSPAVSEALSWVAAWGRMAAAQGCKETNSAVTSPAFQSTHASQPFSSPPGPASQHMDTTTTTATAGVSSGRRRQPEHSLTLSSGSPPRRAPCVLPPARTPKLKQKQKQKRAASAVVGGSTAARPRQKAQPAQTIAFGESRQHLRARLSAPPPLAAVRTPSPVAAVAAHCYAPDGNSTTSLPLLPLGQGAVAAALPLSPVAAMPCLLSFQGGCRSPELTMHVAEAGAAAQPQPQHEEDLWLGGGGGGDWHASPAQRYAPASWQEAAEAELLGCIDAAELDALDAALAALNDAPSPSCLLWL